MLAGVAAVLCTQGKAYAQDNEPQLLNLLVPGPFGGGLDRVALILAHTVKSVGGVPPLRIEYAPGDSGMTGLARFLGRRGQGGQGLIASLSIMGTGLASKPPLRLAEAVPVARLQNEPLFIAAPANSPFRTFADLLRAFDNDPARITFAGGPVGGADHLLAASLARARQVDVKKLSFLSAFANGLTRVEALTERASCAIGSYYDFEMAFTVGQVRLLAASDASVSPVPVEDLQKAEFAVDFENWRGIFAPPGTSAEQQEARASRIERLLASPEWEEAARKNKWAGFRRQDVPFSAYVAQEEDKALKLLKALGLAAKKQE